MTTHSTHTSHGTSHHTGPRVMERHCDVAVVGGSAAGLAAALQLVRQKRSVIVVDAGEPRNAPAAHMHGYLGRDGESPAELTAAGREEVRSYGGEVVAGRATTVTQLADGRFRVELVGGHTIVARRVLAATGLIDELPDIDGVAHHWGGDVIHCPFCHGYEARDRRITQLITTPFALHATELFRQLTDQLTVVIHDPTGVDNAALDRLEASGVNVVRARATCLATGDDGHVIAVDLDGLESIPTDVVVVTPRFRVRAEPFAAMGLVPSEHASGMGNFVEADSTGATSVPGLFAAGNVTDPSQQVLLAAANGSWVGAMISFSLAHDDVESVARPSAHREDWERRYGGEQMWSGNPNGTVVNEIESMAPGRALDVGAGEGGDAVWLAEQGWTVTASDISQSGLDRVDAEATRRGLDISCLQADANQPDAFPVGAFDLVSAQYASIPRTPDDRAIHHMLEAVAPGGTLLVVGHDLEPMRTPVDTTTQSRVFDADAYVRVDDIAAVVTESDRWNVEVHAKRTRPPGAASASHHVDDVVLRATRR